MPPPRHINLDQQAQLQSCTTDIIADGAITNAKLSASADIAFDKLAPLLSGNILIGDASNNATSINPTGDIDISNTGVFSINSNVIVDDDINVLAAISTSKLADASNFLLRNTSNILTDNIRFTYTTNQTFTDPNDLVTKSYVDSIIAPGPSLSQWTTSGSDIYFDSGNVGIGASSFAPGNASPSRLFIAGNLDLTDSTFSNPFTSYAPANSTMRVRNDAGSVGGIGLYAWTAGGSSIPFYFRGAMGTDNAGDTSVAFVFDGTSLNPATGDDVSALSTQLLFSVRNNSDPKVTVLGNGNFGIGATVPATKLHVAGNIQSDGYIYSGGDYVAPCAVLDATSGLYIELSNGTTFQSYSQSVEISSPVFDFVQYRLTNSFTTSKSYDLRLHPTTKAFQIAENAFNVRFQILSSGAAVIHPGGVPSSTSSTGETGQLSFDANFFYVCTDLNTWKRAALSTW